MSAPVPFSVGDSVRPINAYAPTGVGIVRAVDGDRVRVGWQSWGHGSHWWPARLLERYSLPPSGARIFWNRRTPERTL